MSEEKRLSEEELDGVSGGIFGDGDGIPWSNRVCSNCGVKETRKILREADGPNKYGLWGETKLLCQRCFEEYFQPQGWEWM